jgi:hypothetical protein
VVSDRSALAGISDGSTRSIVERRKPIMYLVFAPAEP